MACRCRVIRWKLRGGIAGEERWSNSIGGIGPNKGAPVVPSPTLQIVEANIFSLDSLALGVQLPLWKWKVWYAWQQHPTRIRIVNCFEWTRNFSLHEPCDWNKNRDIRFFGLNLTSESTVDNQRLTLQGDEFRNLLHTYEIDLNDDEKAMEVHFSLTRKRPLHQHSQFPVLRNDLLYKASTARTISTFTQPLIPSIWKAKFT